MSANDDTQYITLAGLAIPLGDHVSSVIREQIEDGGYEAAELAALRGLLKPDDVVMELGTGLGLLSAYCARVVGSERVFTFEANPGLEQPISTLYERNEVSPRLEICVLAERAGTAMLTVDADVWRSSTVTADASVGRVEVPARAFDEARDAIRPTCLVIDIEGGELELLRHARLDGIRLVVIELHPEVIRRDGCEQVLRRLAHAGFAVDTEHSQWDVYALARAAGDADRRAHDAVAHLPWHRAERALEALCTAVPDGAAFVLVDDGLWWEDGEFGDRRRHHLVERDEEDWGTPADGATAVRELERQHRLGATHAALAWPAFWWLEEFPELADRLARCPLVVGSRDLRVWDLG